jgi:hypothetical protein
VRGKKNRHISAFDFHCLVINIEGCRLWRGAPEIRTTVTCHNLCSFTDLFCYVF